MRLRRRGVGESGSQGVGESASRRRGAESENRGVAESGSRGVGESGSGAIVGEPWSRRGDGVGESGSRGVGRGVGERGSRGGATSETTSRRDRDWRDLRRWQQRGRHRFFSEPRIPRVVISNAGCGRVGNLNVGCR